MGGLCVLCDADLLPWLLIVAFAAAIRTSGPRHATRVAAATLAAVAVVAPWAIRNQQVFGLPIVTNTSGGEDFLRGNNAAYYEFLRSAPFGQTWDAANTGSFWNDGARWITTPAGSASELELDRFQYARARQAIVDDPGMFAYASLLRLERLWGVLPRQTEESSIVARRGQRQQLRYAVAIWYVLELALAAVGVGFLGRRIWQEPWLWATLLVVTFTLVHALWWTDLSTRAPLSCVVALAAALGAASLARPSHSTTASADAT